MAERIPQSVSYLVVFRCFLASDGKTPATGKTVAITISKNGGAFGNPNAGATNATEISSGFYKFTLDTTDTGTQGPLAWRGAEATINDAGDVLSIVSANNAGLAALPDVAVGLTGGLSARSLRTGTAQAGAASTITLDAGASATDNLYNDLLCTISSGPGAGQCRSIQSYVGSTKVATIFPAWVTQPTSASVFVLSAAGQVDVGNWLNVIPNALISGRVDASVGAMAANVITAASIAAGALNGKGDWLTTGGTVTVGAMNAGVITAASIAAGALNGKGDWLTSAAYVVPPTAAAIATGVWQDATASDFTVAGSIGKALFVSAAPGASGGHFIAGTNAPVIISNANGDALRLESTGGNGTGLHTIGKGTGHGWWSEGGVSGHGIYGDANGDGHGMYLLGGPSSGRGLKVEALANGHHGAEFIGKGAGLDITAPDNDLYSGLFAAVAEGTITFIQMQRIILASCAGKTNGAPGASFNIRDVADTKNRIAATVDASGNRTAITLDGS